MEHKYTRKYWANGRWNYEYGDAKKSDTPANRPHSRQKYRVATAHELATAGPIAKGQKVVTTGPVGTAGRDERRPSKIPKPTPSDTVNSMRKDGGRRSVQETSKESAARRKSAERSKEDERYNKSMEGSYTRRGNRANRAYEHSASARKVIDEGPSGYRGLDVRALRRRNDAIDAANASIKSKKSVKRKLRKAKYAVSNAKKQLKDRRKYVRDRINKMK